ncbi:helix-turn-helix transcriptional regulator [Acetobacterium malicum]|uniref:helix-turn-helix transcriptional regulator n=1 Tax=Acetobacterium malicum TaxID=52692 RepID=UPI000423CEBA|nr:helix-turn-helix domain-containing protein [Acetobacterium dehalogenans]
MKKDEQILIDAKTAQTYLGVGRTMFYELAKEEDFPTVKIGNRLFFVKDKLQDWAVNRIGCNSTQSRKEVKK